MSGAHDAEPNKTENTCGPYEEEGRPCFSTVIFRVETDRYLIPTKIWYLLINLVYNVFQAARVYLFY